MPSSGPSLQNNTAELEKLAQIQEIHKPSFDQMIEEPQTKKMNNGLIVNTSFSSVG